MYGRVSCAGPSLALAQDEDDWEFQHEASLNQTVAAVRYDAGVAIVVQCRDRALSAALIGMPAGVGGIEVQADTWRLPMAATASAPATAVAPRVAGTATSAT